MSEVSSIIANTVSTHHSAVTDFFEQNASALEAVAGRLAACFKEGGKLLVCGNGGSACDAQHIAGEFVGRFVEDRMALPAIALTADTSALTAIANDYRFEQVFSRQVEAYGKPGDVMIGISTSGNSGNILLALEVARNSGLYTVLLTGEKGRAREEYADSVLAVPSTITARIQEVHIVALHVLAALVEDLLFPKH